MAFLLAGIAVGVTAVALSETDRTRYNSCKTMYSYLGQKNGSDIYRDRVTGVYYADDGFSVKRVGIPGYTPHPVDKERIVFLLTTFNPQQVKWADFTLAMFARDEAKLWKVIFEKYQAPPKPKRPTWGKTLRKKRWAVYDQEVAIYKKLKEEAYKKFLKEDAAWQGKKDGFARSSRERLSAIRSDQGIKMLRKIYGDADASNNGITPVGATVVHTATAVPAPAPMQPVTELLLILPQGFCAGDRLPVEYNGTRYVVTVPEDIRPGDQFLAAIESRSALPEPALDEPAPPAQTSFLSKGISRKAVVPNPAGAHRTTTGPTQTHNNVPPPPPAIGAPASARDDYTDR